MKRFVLVMMILMTVQLLYAQKASQREWTIFQRGKQDYLTGNYQSAENNFRLVLSKLPNSPLLTANHLMLAKTLYKMQRYNESLDECKTFTEKYPGSAYLDDIHYLMGKNYYRLDRFQTALEMWLHVSRTSQDKRLARIALQNAEGLIHNHLDEKTLQQMKRIAGEAYDRHVIAYYLAERYYEKGMVANALAELNELIDSSAGNEPFLDDARRLYDHLKTRKSDALRIAALLPMSGANGQVGKAIFDGAQLAVDNFNRLNGLNVELVPFDYETRLVTALEQMKEIASDRSISAVFGPVENDITAACAAIAEYEHITLITPTATDMELRRLSSHVFQLALPVDVAGHKLARYALDSLKTARTVTLAPIDDYFLQMTRSFTERLQEGQAEIVSEQWYYSGEQDITKHFEELKRLGLKLAFQDSLMAIDSLDIGETQIDSLYRIYQKEKRLQLAEAGTKIDSADIPVYTFDIMFMPIFRDDIGLIASQYAYSNLQAQILGNGDWYDMEALNKNKNYINGLIFISDGYLNEESWDYRQFRNNFRTALKRTPEHFDLLGFDSFNFILNGLSGNGAGAERSNFAKIIEQASTYQGIYRNFDIGTKRYNNSGRILKYIYGQIVPLN